LATKAGQAIRFKESDLRPMGRQAAGVRAIRLKKDDEIISASALATEHKEGNLLVVSEKGFGKLVKARHFKVQRRGGSGMRIGKSGPKTGFIIGVKLLTPDLEEVLVTTKNSKILRTKLGDIPELSRTAQGVRIIRLESGDLLVSITCL
jgi:DNA gyrase subunit A